MYWLLSILSGPLEGGIEYSLRFPPKLLFGARGAATAASGLPNRFEPQHFRTAQMSRVRSILGEHSPAMPLLTVAACRLQS
jgi:hypothetical protein